MANNIDGELYPDDDPLVVCRPVQKSIDASGDEIETNLIGLTDLKCWLSLSADDDVEGDAINAALVLALGEEGSTAVYHGVLLGSAKRTHIVSADGTTLYAHWQSVLGGYHEVSSTIWRTHRPAAAA